MGVKYGVRPHTQHIASHHARPGRGDDRAARDADVPTSRGNPSRGFGRDLGAIARPAKPLERAAFDPSHHLSPSRAHRVQTPRTPHARDNASLDPSQNADDADGAKDDLYGDENVDKLSCLLPLALTLSNRHIESAHPVLT